MQRGFLGVVKRGLQHCAAFTLETLKDLVCGHLSHEHEQCGRPGLDRGSRLLHPFVIETISGAVTSLAGTSHDTRFGWTLGTGLEWAFASNWTANVEYDYVDFGSWSEAVAFNGVFNSFFGAPSSTFKGSTAVNVHAAISEVKLGINYKLSPGVLFW
ncbi:opacity protein-like surface antigen [Bradyrhizobium sp. RT9b]